MYDVEGQDVFETSAFSFCATVSLASKTEVEERHSKAHSISVAVFVSKQRKASYEPRCLSFPKLLFCKATQV